MKESSPYPHKPGFHPDDPDIFSRLEREEHSQRTISRKEASAGTGSRIRAAAYCRVSTSQESQQTSIRMQEAHYRDLIRSHEDWEYAGIYQEAGVSGTKAADRPELQRLIEDCRQGRIDLILTKSISRFARNTTDLLALVRLLLSMDIDLYFEKEQLRTSTMGGEFLLTILGSLAEEESRSISENEKWAVSKRYQNGTFRYSTAPYGYDLVDGSFAINPEEAAVVKRIFQSVLDGKGSPQIAEELNAEKIPTKHGGDSRWHAGTILHLLKNPVYTGDALLQKTFSVAEGGHYTRKKNRGQYPRYLIENHHDPIISHEMYDRVSHFLKQRTGQSYGNPETPPHYPFTGKVICECCGRPMKRTTARKKSGIRHYRSCPKYKKSCTTSPILEENLENSYVTMLNKLQYSIEVLLNPYIKALRASGHNEIRIRQAQRLREILRKRARSSDLEFSPSMFLETVDHITVHDAHHISFSLVCGMTLPEEV